MQASVAQSRAAPLLASARPALRLSVGAWVLGFALPLYLAMRGGGYEAVLRDQVGIALWWILLAGVLVGALPVARLSRAQLIALVALVAFAAWTGIGALWSQSSGRTVQELSRLSCYAAVLALGLASVRAGTRTALIGGVTCAIGLVTVLALLSRLHPAWFPANEAAAFLTIARSRLNYPLNYWNGLAALVAMGAPLLTHFAASARRLSLRMLSAAALPLSFAVVYLTFSRGGWIELASASLVLLALSSGRIWRAATLAVAGAGGALLIAAIHQRPAVDHGFLSGAAGRHGGNQLIVVALVVCAGVALLQCGIALLERNVDAKRALAPRAGISPRAAWVRGTLTVAAVAVLLVAFFAAKGPHSLEHAWHSFKSPVVTAAPGQSASEGRLLAASGEGRYQMWSSALDAFSTKPLTGIGAGTYQLWWAAHGSLYSYVVNAHSLYFETLAETGVVGLALLLALLGVALVGTIAACARRGSVAARARGAAIAASLVAFVVAGGIDWVWQIPAVPVAALLLAAAGMARGPAGRHLAIDDTILTEQAPTPGVRAKLAWVALAALGAAAIAVPMGSAVSLRTSQAQAGAGRLGAALDSARSAHGWEPYAAEPALQQALVLEQAHRLDAAATQATRATSAARTDWRAWLVRSRIEAERGNLHAALSAWKHARSLDRHDPLFRSR
ncbi:MAG: O-antigen ligase family protein [Solirubrobacteraceae bacterium]